jgi:hypothetical protein
MAWFCFNDAFVSAVESPDDPNVLVVRARRKEHLENLIPNCSIITNGGTDYKYRTMIDREKFSNIVQNRVMNIDYDNFKNSVDDDSLHRLYEKFWFLHFQYQK